MQEYGSRTAVLRMVLCAVIAVPALTLSLGGCALLDTEAKPKEIVIPGTDEQSTETAPQSISTSSVSRTPDSADAPPSDSYEYLIKNAPRLSNSGFRTGSSSATGDREDNLSGFHFSTPDRTVRCSVASADNDALACVGERVRGRSGPPPGTPAGCDWQRDYVILNSDDVRSGACANLYPVKYRSMIVPFGSALHIDRFACLNDFSGLYCLESSSDKGFSITRSGYEEISGQDRAPKSMRGNSDATSSSSSPNRRSGTVPSR